MIIKINNLKIRTIIGINEEERIKKQEIAINLAMVINNEEACNSDNINDTVNYDALSNELIDKLSNSNYFLIERIAKEIKTILMNHPLIDKGVIEVIKPGAIKAADCVSVVIDYEK